MNFILIITVPMVISAINGQRSEGIDRQSARQSKLPILKEFYASIIHTRNLNV
jgi:hypothetical protein